MLDVYDAKIGRMNNALTHPVVRWHPANQTGRDFVVGGALNGRRIYGQYPQLYIDNPLDVGRGRLIPQVSVDEYFAELALWFGVPRSDLHLVLPNLASFYTVGGTGSPLGFLPA